MKILNALKFTAVLICIVLMLTVSLFDLIDWIIPGSFSNWVYVTDLAVNAVIVMLALVVFALKFFRKCKEKKMGNDNGQ